MARADKLFLAGFGCVPLLGRALAPPQFLLDACGNEVIAERVSPDRRHRAVLFRRGAGRAPSTQVAILPREAPLPEWLGNVFIADDNLGAAPPGPGGGPQVSLRWLAAEVLLLRYHASARVFRSEVRALGVRVRYLRVASTVALAGSSAGRPSEG